MADLSVILTGEILDSLCEDGILRVPSQESGKRAAVLAFPGLLNIAQGREVF